ncbi:Nif3-like dinuclear metal center hexameric protein [Botrimarina hoheduenensis]|uniref:GTP cyclohydrolase 1 type 2 homolog n=1 Tax=Botrimarina hoheduenensis TaxID=2528000 RepID=A0A5C5W7J6_9BACT|nr:Nif3-like dinuclear metal center hexameric protein [Botrimarina hoheduenensis]TWT46660.1 GTP cyclohydrolase 1 type 2 [Botrimarina hoheduenensis]
MPTTIAHAVALLNQAAPLHLAEDWDNVGLLLGDPGERLRGILVCLTLTADVAEEAIARGDNLIVTHHPLPFRPLDRITTETHTGTLLWKLARAGVAIYSAHTAFDSASNGANDHLASALGLTDVAVLDPAATSSAGGTGRIGCAAATLGELAERARVSLRATSVRATESAARPAGRVAVACGSGGSLLEMALAVGCDTLVTGEASFHDCLKAQSAGVAVLLIGHFASERSSLDGLAERLAAEIGVPVTASQIERDPLQPV